MEAAWSGDPAYVDPGANPMVQLQLPLFGPTADSDRQHLPDRLGLHRLRDVA
jgi:hypothetical protein